MEGYEALVEQTTQVTRSSGKAAEHEACCASERRARDQRSRAEAGDVPPAAATGGAPVVGGAAGGDAIAGFRRVVSDVAGVIIIDEFVLGGIVSPSAGAPVKARRGTSM